MIQSFVLLLFVAAIVAGVRPAEAAPATTIYKITGTVTNSVDDSPIPHAHLTAMLAASGEHEERRSFRRGGPEAGIEADADDNGRFVIAVPSPGRWRLLASAAGYVKQAYNAHDEFSSAVVLTQTQPHFDLQFRLPPEAEILGTVLDEAGEAVRNARVILEHRPTSSPDSGQDDFRNWTVAQTDDRGAYDFSGLAPGEYRVKVDAKPWYSISTRPQLSSANAVQNPGLDVTYQLTWYPGVNNATEAEVLSMKAADVRRADFQLIPVPAVHVTFAAPETVGSGSRRFPSFPVVERIDSGGAGLAAVIPNRGNDGRMDVGGLAPGIYRIRMAGPNQEPESRLIEVRAGGSTVIDATSAESDVTDVTIEDEGPAVGRPAGVVLKDARKGTRFASFSQDMFFRGPNESRPDGRGKQPVKMQVPSGKYEVLLSDRQRYLLGLSAKGAGVSGRFITLRGGEVTLKVHTASGRASVHGIVSVSGRPVEGAMVLMVPASLNDPDSFARIVRDQTNTDGSFDLNGVVPGQYILIAVERAWQLRWEDAAFLERYLPHGIPLEVHPDATLSENLNAQQP
jgi:hypothetical protein